MDCAVVNSGANPFSLSGTVIAMPQGHDKARTERPPCYPERFPVPDSAVQWSQPYPGYQAIEINSAAIRGKLPAALAAQDSLTKEEFLRKSQAGEFTSFEGSVQFDQETGRPLNIRGRTGLQNRGLLWNWGANYAADPIVIRFNKEGGFYEMIAILRDNGEWAIPGGFVNKGESVSSTLVRELREETTGGKTLLDFMESKGGKLLYQGYSDDPRNTDNAWIETTASLFLLPPEVGAQVTLKADDDALAVKWMPLTPEELTKPMYSNHKDFVLLALAKLRSQ